MVRALDHFRSAGAESGVPWLFAPGLALNLLWSWTTTPGTRLHAVRERLLVRMARRARALGV